MEMTRKEIEEIMEEKENWQLGYITGDGKGNFKSVVFLYLPTEEERHRRFPIPSYNCTVKPNGEFMFSYVPDDTIVKLETPFCSPIDNADHFERIQTIFEKEASLLYKYRKREYQE